MSKLNLYFCDTETTGLLMENSIIEFSLIRYNTGEQRTWLIKADEPEELISDEALKVNHHSKEDILHRTAYGRQAYIEPEKAIAEIENWLMEDNVPSEHRIIAGQNVSAFDRDRIVHLWEKYNQKDTFPFNPRLTMDTLNIEVFLSFLLDEKNERYSLGGLVEKYGVKKLKAHRADADCSMVRDVFNGQVQKFKSLIK